MHVTPEMQEKLAHLAALQGRNTDELVQDVLTRYLEEEARFIEAIRLGEDALERGEYLTHEEVGERLERLFQSSMEVRWSPRAAEDLVAHISDRH